MKYIAVAIVLLVGTILYFFFNEEMLTNVPEIPSISNDERATSSSFDSPAVTVIAENLDTPWDIEFLPDNSILVTERKGSVRKINPEGSLEEALVATLPNVLEIGEGGLLGMALHPEFETNNYIYFYYTYQNTNGNTLNRVVRMKYIDGNLSGEETILDAIPGASNHNGGRIAFGPDNYLYITTGDAQDPSQSQNTNSLAGKILRVTEDGHPAPGNPFNNRTYSYGHRNPQGIAWDPNGNLWSTEHGRSGVLSGFDEVNLIQSGNNYGWPDIQGDDTKQGMQTPIIHSSSTYTWAPGSIAIIGDSIFFGGLRGQSLYEGVIENNSISEITKHFEGEYGRIREVTTGPDGLLYISTSNLDGRGAPQPTDDKIIRVNPNKF